MRRPRRCLCIHWGRGVALAISALVRAAALIEERSPGAAPSPKPRSRTQRARGAAWAVAGGREMKLEIHNRER